MTPPEDPADDHAVLAAVNALGASQKEMDEALLRHGRLLTSLATTLDETDARLCSLQASMERDQRPAD